MAILGDGLQSVLLRWNACHRSRSMDCLPVGIGVIAFVGQHSLHGQSCDQVGQMRTVSSLSTRHFQHDRMPQGIHHPVEFRAKPAATTAQRLGRLTTRAISFFFAPAAATLARTQVLSTLSHSVSSSRKAAAILAQTPR